MEREPYKMMTRVLVGENINRPFNWGVQPDVRAYPLTPAASFPPEAVKLEPKAKVVSTVDFRDKVQILKDLFSYTGNRRTGRSCAMAKAFVQIAIETGETVYPQDHRETSEKHKDIEDRMMRLCRDYVSHLKNLGVEMDFNVSPRGNSFHIRLFKSGERIYQRVIEREAREATEMVALSRAKGEHNSPFPIDELKERLEFLKRKRRKELILLL